ncbi:Peptidyl-prolyl cis-trans isomerase D [Defluviimonas aquaemixtae]|uniref:Peptidyl-prolyl cis-trans isomerase D n=1 Tax=Albidovulum aquaemixtae TaxID=1542388 RepID=A0A2R8B531_9RHOB|nr:peptidylprolyl isomerase [Defluviimonas aquaemixtae]SPH17719.1 Peptidyl-prolyl cis-trans isomerase D [Defluviimonas aquaemixtae]
MSNPLRSKKRGSMIIWILVGMLVLGLGGFGARNFGGSVRAIGSVGDTDIDLRDYARTLNREISAFSAQLGQPVSFAQAQSLGIDRSVLARVISSAALDNEADRIGISVGDEEVRRRVLAFDAFAGLDGSFDRDAYALTLRQEGLSEAEFEGKLRDEAARTLLQGAALGGTAAPDALVDRVAAWLTETRSFTVAELIASDLAETLPEPDEAALMAYYEAHPDDFTRPEIRRISYIWLSPDMLADDVQLDDEALSAAYQERIDDYVTPERRLVERLVYPDEATAASAKARYDAGEATFEALAAERGLALADIDMGEVTEADLGGAGEAVFALDAPGVVGPLPSDLGPALYAMNGILEAREIAFEDARADLATEAALDRARRLVADQSDGIEDLLAGGATLEEVAEDTGMEFGQIEMAPDTDEGIAAYTGFRDAAREVTETDFPTLAGLDDGGVFALRLDGIDPPALRPLAEVRDAVIEGWTKAETTARLAAMGEEIAARVEAGEDLAASGFVTTRYDEFARDGHIDGAPPALAERVFKLDEGGAAVVEGDGVVFVAALGDIHKAERDGAEFKATRAALATQIGQSLAQDMFQLYTQALSAEAGIRLDQSAVNAVHAQMN